ncbi:MAG: hypothetical protein FWC40_06215, partial [Proteobacteria bacterium]|nr:hypothetical protein [Pseudomonadota bacterium]
HSHGADILIALKHAADTIAPLWLAAACLLFVLYRLASHPKQNLQETGRRLASILNPPPGSAAFDKRPRWLAATGIIAFLTVFDWRFNAFFALACACIILYACLEMRNLPTRTDTPPCTTHNTFTQWLATSWSQLIIFALALSALPSFLDPLKSFLITHDPSLTIAVFAGLSLLLLLALFYSQTHIPTIAIATAMALMMSLPAPPIPRTVIAMILGLGLCTVFRNGYHSRGAQALAANDATLRPAIRRIQILAPCLIIALATLPAWLTPGNKLSDMTTVHNLATPPEDTHLHDAEPGSHLPFSLPLALFATAGMVLIFRHGPRKLVTMALGKQPHTHG